MPNKGSKAAKSKPGRRSLAKKASKLGLLIDPPISPGWESQNLTLAQPDRRTYVNSVTTYGAYEKPI